jgi:hypothetical protein
MMPTRQQLAKEWLAKLLVDNTLFIDNSRLEQFTTCPRQAQYAVIDRMTSSATKQALSFGEAMHLALELRYKLIGHGPVTADLTSRQDWLLEEYFKVKPCPLEDHRNLGYGTQMMRDYNKFYPREDFTLLEPMSLPIDPNLSSLTRPAGSGPYVVEQPFSVYLGEVNGVKVVWTGRMDLPLEKDGNLYVMDHKTSSMGGDYFFQEFFNSSQLLGYCYATQKVLKRPVKGAIINAMFTRKITATGQGIGFQRAVIPFDQDRITEWQFNTLSVVGNFLQMVKDGFLPMHTKWCVHKYGRCQYWDVCTLSAEARDMMLNKTNAYIPDDWSPLRDRALQTAPFLTQPVPPEFLRTNVIQRQGEDLGLDYMKLIM